MSADDRTALLEELPGPVAQELIKLLSFKEFKIAKTLLAYAEDSVGRLMSPDFLSVKRTGKSARCLNTSAPTATKAKR